MSIREKVNHTESGVLVLQGGRGSQGLRGGGDGHPGFLWLGHTLECPLKGAYNVDDGCGKRRKRKKKEEEGSLELEEKG